ncbi:MAG: GNAT family N-acetyltransferase [bacterium]|uniref:GNAT family N-acetyltransferase n=1 Tax=Candidatus Methylomirabilis tolerans TaxID=3123416 RepID=A0AAJ1EJK5_9BACT|nr:GNAT family N-acetyltransferase [Candidatus Methylomirabilis sp.]
MDTSLRNSLDSYETYLVERNHSMGCLVAIAHPFVLFVNDEITVSSYNYADIVPWSAMPSRERIDEVMAHYRARGHSPHFNFTLETAPEGLIKALQSADCALKSHKYVMFQHEPGDPPVPADVRLGQTGPEDMPAAGRILSVSFGSGESAWQEPTLRARLVTRMRAAGMRQLGVWVDGQLAAAVHLHTAVGVGHITGMATAPEFRGRGLAGLLTAYAARCARDEGAAFVALEVATPEAERVYARVGFRRAAERVEYVATA